MTAQRLTLPNLTEACLELLITAVRAVIIYDQRLPAVGAGDRLAGVVRVLKDDVTRSVVIQIPSVRREPIEHLEPPEEWWAVPTLRLVCGNAAIPASQADKIGQRGISSTRDRPV